MKTTGLLSSALAVAAALCIGTAALAQDASQEESNRRRLDRIEKQLNEVRQIVLQAHATGAPVEIKEAGPDPQVTALQGKLDDMEQTLRGLTGQFETLSHALDLAKADAAAAHAQAAALSDRLDRLEKQVAAQTAPPSAPLAGGPPDAGARPPSSPDEAKAAYAHARQLLLDGDYPAASAAFQDYVDRYADTPSATPARYWLGETKYIQDDYAGAAAAYLGAIRGWPQTAWAPEAVVKLSLSLAALHKNAEACGALAELDRRYPRAPPATKARAAAAREKIKCEG
jgi:tol-pal system protein YbgF